MNDKVICRRFDCDKPVKRRKDRLNGPTLYCSGNCRKVHATMLARGWGLENDQAYEEAR